MTENSTRSAIGTSPPQADDDSGRADVLSVGSGIAVLLSAAASALGYMLLPPQMRIHWTFGAGPYYGPEFAPTGLVLAIVPVVVAGVALGARLLDGRLQETAGGDVRPYHTAVVVVTVLCLLGIQVLLIGANL